MSLPREWSVQVRSQTNCLFNSYVLGFVVVVVLKPWFIAVLDYVTERMRATSNTRDVYNSIKNLLRLLTI